MTGPQKRVLTGYDEIHNRHAHPDGASASASESYSIVSLGGGRDLATPTLIEHHPGLQYYYSRLWGGRE